MIFGGFKGFRPHGGLRTSVVIVLGVVQLLGLAGYLGGFFDRTPSGRLEWHEFQWDTGTIISTIVMWCSWVAAISMLLMSKVDDQVKLGGSFLISLPVALFVFLFFELIEFGSR